MRSAVGLACAWTQQLALALWLGGGIVLGAVSAPATFGLARDAGQTDWSQPLYRFAGTALGEGFRRFNSLAMVCAAVALLTGLAAAGLLRWNRPAAVLAEVLLAGATGGMGFLTVSLFPRMLAERAAGRMELFDAGHHAYTQAFGGVLILLLAAQGLILWMANQAREPRPHAVEVSS